MNVYFMAFKRVLCVKNPSASDQKQRKEKLTFASRPFFTIYIHIYIISTTVHAQGIIKLSKSIEFYGVDWSKLV